jgi:hypothetical protein
MKPRGTWKKIHWAWTMAGLLAALSASGAAEAEDFVFSGEPIHPACVEALAMQSGDAIPVTKAVSLTGCAASQRSRLAVEREGSFRTIHGPAGGSFGYALISTLDNGIFVIGIRRTDAQGASSVSLAAVDIRQQPQLMRTGEVAQRWILEMVGEVWLPGMDLASVQTVGNRVHFVAGVGASRKEEVVDLTRIGRARR